MMLKEIIPCKYSIETARKLAIEHSKKEIKNSEENGKRWSWLMPIRHS